MRERARTTQGTYDVGIESDQLVFDYLSRVGDLAQQHQLTSGDRMRLVTSLRGEIDRQRAKAIGGPDSAATVQRILGRLGSPDEIVEAAGEGGVQAVLSARTSPRGVPRQRKARTESERETEKDDDRGPYDAPDVRGGRGARDGRGADDSSGGAAPRPPVGFRKRTANQSSRQSSRQTSRQNGRHTSQQTGRHTGVRSDEQTGPSSPHLAGADELGPSDGDAEWWRTDPGPFGGLGTSIPGFTGGVEIPEILKPPPEDDEDDEEEEEGDEEYEDEGVEAAAYEGRRRWLPRRLRRRTAAVVVVDDDAALVRGSLVPRGSPFLLLAALLLVVGAALGNLLVLAGGWFLAYFSRRLTRTEAKWAVLGLPGLVAAGGAIWLWGRTEGRWGAPLSLQAEGAMGDALVGLWPVLLRTAAVISALYVVWRARRLDG